MNILASAQDFGFGPMAMLNNIACQLPPNFHLSFWLPPQLAARLDGATKEASTILPYEPNGTPAHLSQYDGMLVACDYDLVARIGTDIHDVVILDMLLWFWPRLPQFSNSHCLVIAQNFFGVTERAHDVPNTIVVSPFQNDAIDPHRTKHQGEILINLGGFESPYHGPKEARIYGDLLRTSLNRLCISADTVTVAGGDLILEALRPELAKRCSLRAYRHDEMATAISECGMYLTTPGIGSIYEAFQSRTSTFFLPPTNLTQLRQLQLLTSQIEYPFAFLPTLSRTPPRETTVDEEGVFIRHMFTTYKAISRQLERDLDNAVTAFTTVDEEASTHAFFLAKNFLGSMDVANEPSPLELVVSHLLGRRDS